ncbi:pyrroline-5-carboxylate reductase [Roseibium sp. MMSF_3544]|uniref:pyrroline-5-carboxylate reductase family protein n=1 Tax=unclassified Roseibium TaxID=2629323 RepID=UPI00273F057F|nr:pyrroline-5-carboxylate reductase dimerization domain-containing protein [Roseibium sp. MMSF_3544]
MSGNLKIGIIGGTGQLGSAIATGWLEAGCVAPDDLWISNRSGTASGFDAWPEVNFTASNQELADVCDVILLSVPPALIGTIGIVAPDKLVISVMAGVSREQIMQLTGSSRAVRAMSSPAARYRQAYSPWFDERTLNKADRDTVCALLSAIGASDELPDESQIEVFTVVTGPVPGFAAFFADCMVQFAVANNVDPDVAVRAAKQLMTSSASLMSSQNLPPSAYVKEMIDYGGTTTAGLVKLQELGVAGLFGEGLKASLERVRAIAPDD